MSDGAQVLLAGVVITVALAVVTLHATGDRLLATSTIPLTGGMTLYAHYRTVWGSSR